MRLEPLSFTHEGQYRLVNDQGSSDEASLLVVVDGAMGPWADYGACTKTCTPANMTSGEGRICTNLQLTNCQGARSGQDSASLLGTVAFHALAPWWKVDRVAAKHVQVFLDLKSFVFFNFFIYMYKVFLHKKEVQHLQN